MLASAGSTIDLAEFKFYSDLVSGNGFHMDTFLRIIISGYLANISYICNQL